MCGFRPYHEISHFLKEYPDLIELLGSDAREKIENGKSAGLKEVFTILMTSKANDIEKCIAKLSKRFESSTSEFAELFKKLQTDFPNDVGVLSIFFMNVLYLEPGQAIFLPANEIHAYLDGGK